MSVIDQAFIRAYADLDVGMTPAEPLRQPPSRPQQLTPPPAAEQPEPPTPVAPPTPPAPLPQPQRQPRSEPAEASLMTYICDTAEACPPAPHVAMFEVIAEDRQPLSEFVRLTPARDAFQPAVQVEQFSWPATCDRIAERLRLGLEHAAERLAEAVGEGRRVVAITGCHRGAGSTTTLLCLARYLATAETPVAMVDADFQQPELARRLGIATPAGWEDVLRDQLPLASAVVTSVQDHVALLPVRSVPPDADQLAGNLPASISLRVLRQHYDMVLVDLGPILDPSVAGPALKLAERSGIDAALLVRDTRATTDSDLRAAARALRGAGVTTVGVAETFVTANAGVPRADAAHTIQFSSRGHATPAQLAPVAVRSRSDVRQHDSEE